ncbi:pectin lyase fold/virulence factor [Mycena alexandri]|uniref:galacturonan 1,4-alpha-galacturonidase n=1 Tax=Mycena alexandri TaxID=1745969 RepID=A0AAD6RVY0_9AGAR|nr:pectin lyase fold/virulence factor [Mycena alexandri]
MAPTTRPAILAAFADCGKGGKVLLPSANYTVAQPMTTHMEGGSFDLHGYLSFTPDIDYGSRIPNPRHRHITGSDFVVDGHGTGGVFGNGQVWYSWAQGAGNLFGTNFRIIQPQFWASMVWNSTDILLTDFYVNAINMDPAVRHICLKESEKFIFFLRRVVSIGCNNTDGSDTYASKRITYQNWVYQGGDDCIAFKPNSTQITARNVSCTSLNGMTFGSIGQYPDSTSLSRTSFVRNHPTAELEGGGPYSAQLDGGAYFKSWIGVDVGTPPNGGGGGHGYCKNVTIRNLHIINATVPLLLTSELTYSRLNATYANTSTFIWERHPLLQCHRHLEHWASDSTLSAAPPRHAQGGHLRDINLTPVGGVATSRDTVCHNFFNYTGLPQCTA